jgi:hypothetical protein
LIVHRPATLTKRRSAVTTATNRVNSRPRSTLADQIDRLDGILDGLGEALTEAVADAVKEAVKAAVADLDRRPEVVGPATDAKASSVTPTRRDRLRRIAGRAVALVRNAFAWVANKVRRANAWVQETTGPICARARSVGSRAATVMIATVAGYRAGIEDCCRWHRPALLAGALALLAGVAWVLAGPFAAFLACGGLAVAFALRVGDNLIGRNRSGGQWPDSAGHVVPQLSASGSDYWI